MPRCLLLVCSSALWLMGCGPTSNALGQLPAGAERVTLHVADSPNNSTDLSYLRAGPRDAPRLIFVHGTPGDAANYLAYLADPPPGFEVLAIDRPGFGQSPADDPASLTFAGQAAALAPLLVERDGRWPIVVGHSLGGPIVCRLAADEPERVGGLVVLAGSVDPDLESPRWYNWAAALPPIGWLLPAPLRRANDEVFAAPQQTRELAKVLREVRSPTAIVQGGQDSLVPPGNADYLMHNLPDAESLRLYFLKDAGHFLPWEHEATVRRAISELDAEVSR